MNLKQKFSNLKGKTVAIAAAAGVPMLYAGSAFAALSTEETAMITSITTKMDDLGGAARTLIASNLTLIATIIIGGFILAYMWKAGRG